MSKFVIVAFSVLSLLSGVASADRASDIKTLFTKVNSNSKGAFGRNTYQRPNGRTEVLQDSGVSGAPRDTLFVVAYRTGDAVKLANLGVYVGNRFTSNYWELNNKYNASEQDRRSLGFHPDQARFLANAAIAPDAFLMAKNMILESFYMQKFPNTRLTRANQQRGTADADNEKTYYGYFIEYLAKYTTNSYDYLTLFEIQRRFNLTGDSSGVSLQRLRDEVASIYDNLAASSPNSAMAYDFRAIRNSIHNYMTPDVLVKLNSFLNSYGRQLGSWEAGRIQSLRDSVVAYYRTDKKVLVAGAKALGAVLPADTANVLNMLTDRGNTPAVLEQFSWLLTKSRESFVASRNPDVIHWLIKSIRFISSELSARPLRNGDDWAVRARIALDCAYVAGLVAPSDWTQVRTSLTNALQADVTTLRSLHQEMTRVISASPVMLRGALSPALEDWVSVDRTMEGVVDDSIRSSMMTEFNNVTLFLKARLPAQAQTIYSIENEGEAYGYLVYVPKGSTENAVARLDKTMIPVFAELPLDLGVVAGIITEQPQTPLSHVSIKSKARGTPNVFYPAISADPQYRDLIVKKALVRLTLKDGFMTIREVSLEEARMAWARMHAPTKVEIRADLNEKRLRSTKDLGSKDIITVGAKAANYGEASKALPAGVMLEAYSIPFFYYKQFVDEQKYDANTTFSQRIKALLADPRMNTDREYRIKQLDDLQKHMTEYSVPVNAELVANLQKWADTAYPGRTLKFRSSTNSEDLANFSGAGLYDSYSYDPAKPKKSIAQTLKRTWASVWNIRAFDEREHFGIPHADVYMGMLVSPGFPSEAANGVAVTRNIKVPSLGAGVYINGQLGEDAVTNPDPTLVPEELLVLQKPDAAAKLPFTLKYLKYSTKSPGQPILTNDEAVQLTNYLLMIHKRLKAYFDPQNKNKDFAIDVEWKINLENGARRIFIKQARPYVDGNI